MIPDMPPVHIHLLPTEEVLVEKPANYVIRLHDYQVSTSALSALMPLIGMRGKEAIGGTLSLTNYRLVFQAHAINRVHGTFSIFLPTIRDLHNTSVLIVRKLQVATRAHDFEFVLWGISPFMTAIRHAQSALADPHQQEDLRQLVAANVDTFVESLEMREVAEALIHDVNRDVTGLHVHTSLDVIQLHTLQELLQLLSADP